MKLSEWIRHREITGKPCFSFSDVTAAFADMSEQPLLNSLSRYVRSKRLALVARGFYCIIPPQYALQGLVPPSYYVDQLMSYIGKLYYVGLVVRRLLGRSSSASATVFYYDNLSSLFTVER